MSDTPGRSIGAGRRRAVRDGESRCQWAGRRPPASPLVNVTPPCLRRVMGDHRDLNELDLSAHCLVKIRIYGNETVRIADIRGDVAATADAEVVLKNLRITGPLPRLLAAFQTMAALGSEAIHNPDAWDSVPDRRFRQGKRLGDWGPFVTSLERPRLRTVED